MKVINKIEDLNNFLTQIKSEQPELIVGFVPTMGALHAGHLSLIEQAKKQSDFVVCSIFVNPTQFNDKSDLEKYPRTIEADIELLDKNKCDLVFIPSVEDIYPNNNTEYAINLNGLNTVLEGKYRPGHFDGVCMVVERLFNIINPNKAFFGIKDFQQVAIIKYMTKLRGFDIDIVACPIMREDSGLAMSSRNTLLSEKQKKDATVLSKTILKGKDIFLHGGDIQEMNKEMLSLFNSSNLELEYLEIVDNDSLKSVNQVNNNCSICIAAYCGNVRLIDNCQLL
jgi:pantoate--beta-alanine ligase